MSLPQDAARPLIDAYVAAVAAKDVDAFMRFYDAEVRVFDTWGTWSYESADLWRKVIEGWFSSLGNGSVAVSFEEVRCHVAGAVTVVTAFVGYCGRSAQDVVLHSMQNRMTWVLQDKGSGLRIIHEHTSVPVDFGDAKGILLRDAQKGI